MRVNRLVGGATVVAALLALGAGLTGCTRTGTQAIHTLAPAVTSPTAATPGPVSATTKAAAPVKAAYEAARAQWVAGATAISADQGKFWSAAMADLNGGMKTDSDPTGYAHAIDALKSLIALPDAQQTPAQNAEYHTDINDLNSFFKTPGLYS
jgi:hypothetical protein